MQLLLWNSRAPHGPRRKHRDAARQHITLHTSVEKGALVGAVHGKHLSCCRAAGPAAAATARLPNSMNTVRIRLASKVSQVRISSRVCFHSSCCVSPLTLAVAAVRSNNWLYQLPHLPRPLTGPFSNSWLCQLPGPLGPVSYLTCPPALLSDPGSSQLSVVRPSHTSSCPPFLTITGPSIL